MKKTILCLVAVLAFATANAQNNQPITNGDFEQWTTSGYGPLSTTTCNTWNSLGIDLGFFPYNLTEINKTTEAQHGSYAAYIESGKLDPSTATALESIISGFDTAGIVSNYLDLHNSIFPGIMMKGNINIMNAAQTFFGMVMDLGSVLGGIDSTFNMSDISSLINLIEEMDFSSILVDGMAVQGTPAELNGYYKYVVGTPDSVNNTDHGAAFLLGTYYDAATHSRKIAGAGATMFSAMEVYAPFEVSFIPINENTVDTTFIFFLSSLYNGLEGTKLYVDNLSMTLMSCDDLENVTSSQQNNSVMVSWDAADVMYYEVEYGQPGFAIGTGVREQVSTSHYTFAQPTESVTYDVYVRAVCDLGNSSNWSAPISVTIVPTSVDENSLSNVCISPNPSAGKFSISCNADSFSVNVYNSLGQTISQYTGCTDGFSFGIEQNGMYFVEIVTATTKEIRKVIVAE